MDVVNSSYEVVAIVFPSPDHDATMAMLHEQAKLHDDYRKFFVGPLVGTNESHIYLLTHDGDNATFPMREAIGKITQVARSLQKGVSIVRLAFGGKDKLTRVLESTDSKIVSDEDVNTRLKMNLLEGTNKILRNQIEEMQRLRDKDQVVAQGIADLEYLYRHKELIGAIKESRNELRANRQLSEQSCQRVLSLLDEMERRFGA